MIVVDASVIVDLILDVTTIARRLKPEFGRAEVAAPHLIDAEVIHALRRHLLRGEIATTYAHAALQDYLVLTIDRYPHTHLLPRAFQLRDHATVYDALYLALAESLGATLLTRDRALATIPGVTAEVEVIGAVD